MAFDPINYEGQDRLAHIEKYVGQNTAAIAVLNGGVISAPATITSAAATGPTSTPLTLKAITNQAGDILKVQNSTGTTDVIRWGYGIPEGTTGGPSPFQVMQGPNGGWSMGIDVGATIKGRDFFIAKMGGVDGATPGTVFDCFYIEHNGTSPPSIQINNSSAFNPQGSLEVMMATDGSGNVLDATASNVVIHTGLITGGTPQTQPAIRMRNWTSGTDRFHLEANGDIAMYDAGGTVQVAIGATTGAASFKGTSLNVGASAYGTTSHNLYVYNGASNADLQIQTSAGGTFLIQCLNASGTVNLWTTNNSDLLIGTNGVVRLTVAKTTGALTQAYSQTLAAGASDITLETKTPVIAGAFTATRLNYMQVSQPSGAATITDAAVFQFDAAIGTHKAVDSGTTKTSPGTVTAWVKVNINGTIHYMPAYASKTT